MRRARTWAIGAGLAAGIAVGAATASRADQWDALRMLAQVAALVTRHYVHPVSHETLLDGAISGMLTHLDPYSSYLSPAVNALVRESIAGRYVGIGVEVEAGERGFTVIAPVEGSPAQRAGLRPGDVVVAIDGAPCAGMGAAEAAARIRGPEGTVVTLTVVRPGEPAHRDIAVRRAPVRVRPVVVRPDLDGVAVVRIRVFSQGTASALRAVVRRARDGCGVVLDLRDNPGGLVEEAVRCADLFVSSGVLLRVEGRGPRSDAVYRAHRRGTAGPVPVAVVVNRATASAAEILAGILRDRLGAVVLGETTFGKGSVQTLFDLPNGGAAKLTTGVYRLPGGAVVDGRGLAPDVAVPAARDAVGGEEAGEGPDRVLHRAAAAVREAGRCGR